MYFLSGERDAPIVGEALEGALRQHPSRRKRRSEDPSPRGVIAPLNFFRCDQTLNLFRFALQVHRPEIIVSSLNQFVAVWIGVDRACRGYKRQEALGYRRGK